MTRLAVTFPLAGVKAMRRAQRDRSLMLLLVVASLAAPIRPAAAGTTVSLEGTTVVIHVPIDIEGLSRAAPTPAPQLRGPLVKTWAWCSR